MVTPAFGGRPLAGGGAEDEESRPLSCPAASKQNKIKRQLSALLKNYKYFISYENEYLTNSI